MGLDRFRIGLDRRLNLLACQLKLTRVIELSPVGQSGGRDFSGLRFLSAPRQQDKNGANKPEIDLHNIAGLSRGLSEASTSSFARKSSMRDSLLPRYELIAENWRHFNNIRPHSSLNCRQPKICAGRPGYVTPTSR